MAKDKSEKKERKERKEKKEKRSEVDGVKKSKEKKLKLSGDNIAAAIEEVNNGSLIEAAVIAPADGEIVVKAKPLGALVPFANPLADEKTTKKVLKCVKKGMFIYLAISSSTKLRILTRISVKRQRTRP